MITFQKVSKRFWHNKKQIVALEELSFSIESGEFVVFEGASGSGKSTILSLIAALQKPTSGRVVVDGVEVSKLSEDFAAHFRLKTIGFIFQKFHLLTRRTVFENVIAPLIPLNLPRREVEQKAYTLLEQFGLLQKKSVDVRHLSGGEQQRVAIMRALINEPSIIIADEPTANLDKALAKELLEALQRLHKKGKTIVVASHDPLFFDLDVKRFVLKDQRIVDAS